MFSSRFPFSSLGSLSLLPRSSFSPPLAPRIKFSLSSYITSPSPSITISPSRTFISSFSRQIPRVFSPPLLHSPSAVFHRAFSRFSRPVASKTSLERQRRLWSDRESQRHREVSRGAFIRFDEKLFGYSDLPGSHGDYEIHDKPKGVATEKFADLEDRTRFKIQTEEGLKRLVRNEIKLERLHRMRKPKKSDLLKLLSEVDLTKGDFAKSYERYFGPMPSRQELSEEFDAVFDDDLESWESQVNAAIENPGQVERSDAEAQAAEGENSQNPAGDSEDEAAEAEASRIEKSKKSDSPDGGKFENVEADEEIEREIEEEWASIEENEENENSDSISESVSASESDSLSAEFSIPSEEKSEETKISLSEELQSDLEGADILPPFLESRANPIQMAVDLDTEIGSTTRSDPESLQSGEGFDVKNFVRSENFTRSFIDSEGNLFEYETEEGEFDPIFFSRLIGAGKEEFDELMTNEPFRNNFEKFLHESTAAMRAARDSGVDLVRAKEDYFTLATSEFDRLYPALAGKWKFQFDSPDEADFENSLSELEETKLIARTALENGKAEESAGEDRIEAKRKEIIGRLIKELQSIEPELKNQSIDIAALVAELESEFVASPPMKEIQKFANSRANVEFLSNEEIEKICSDIIERVEAGA